MPRLSKEEISKRLLELIKDETKPAIGCTEPVAVAFTVAIGKKYMAGEVLKIDLKVSKNILKNGKSVTIPNTEVCGLDIAGALGGICGDPEEGLFVFKNVNKDYLDKAREMIKNKVVTLNPIENTDPVFVEATLKGEKDEVIAILEGGHTNIERIIVNGKIAFEKDNKNEKDNKDYDFMKELSLKDIREITEDISIEKLDFIMDGIEMNKEAAKEGLKRQKGLTLGSSLLKLQQEGKLGKDSATIARILTAAGSDLRMGGGMCPIMTSGGSGNQGLCVILPITVVAEDTKAPKEKLQRAVFFGHAVNNFVKKYTGKLSAICGCAIAAGIGATAGIAWLLGGKDKEINGAILNMLANLTGMVCDGAKGSCAIKLSTSASEAVISAYLALNDIIVPNNTGIIGNTVEDTINNLGMLCKDGFYKADDVMLSIACKEVI
ncbi:TPA: serine dehydratase subunit alpha family protein [Clostridium botulinum]|uniref:L-cysteine desulfidase family protein n=1 Tax=Clostridium botulinum TaxID=1491 RepID=UPI000D0CC652|nr:L-serine ammonia-lyase, iron-sulfur-dependent, subunit alpha [Clostridium botulinum]PSM01477.1 serine dehydratase subunit alpha family protein [Clostridium botulinum]HDK7136716.1 serine dehydratase subunit alpha family protein [Clostridium botulinum]HDK7140181.1 serine dehydratase subunit alpha family protein [Clostridium botulinum]HDK7140349.1 serine dehydratase subunit alpha family protein [Clostridium botulinum]HDK7143852.1 serine dehydratase subunit alpha family protein [Clostridium bot